MSTTTDSPDGHVQREFHVRAAVRGPQSSTGDQSDTDSHVPRVTGGTNSGGGHKAGVSHVVPAAAGPILADEVLEILAASVDDLEKARMAMASRYEHLTRTGADKDGITRGLGLSDDVPEVAQAHLVLDALVKVENLAVSNLEKHVAKHPLWKHWAAQQSGVGKKTLARLLASIGDPYWNETDNRARTVSALWAYSGYHTADGAAPRARKGQKRNWSTSAKTRTFLIAQCCKMQTGRGGKPDPYYRQLYVQAKAKQEGAVHSAPCERCGPSGKPAPAGSLLNGKHKDARAMRELSKAILRDLWRTARDLHEAAA